MKLSKQETRTTPYAMAYSGRKWFFLEPRAEDIYLDDIAHSLSHIPRFNGHTEWVWSVAQHSIMCYLMALITIPEYAARLGWSLHYQSKVVRSTLLHDVPEGYLGDMTRPLRKCLPEYDALYFLNEFVIFKHCGVVYDDAVAEIDDRNLVTEAQMLLNQALPEEDKWWTDKKRYPFVSYAQDPDPAVVKHYMHHSTRLRRSTPAEVKAEFLGICAALGLADEDYYNGYS